MFVESHVPVPSKTFVNHWEGQSVAITIYCDILWKMYTCVCLFVCKCVCKWMCVYIFKNAHTGHWVILAF